MSISSPSPWFIPRLIRDRQRTFGTVTLRMPVERPSSLLTRPNPPRRLAEVGLLAGLLTARLAHAPSPVAASLPPQPESAGFAPVAPRSVPPLEFPPPKASPTSPVPVPSKGAPLQTDSQAKAVEVIAHHLTIAFAEARGPVWATAAGLASVLVPVLKAGVSALPKGGE